MGVWCQEQCGGCVGREVSGVAASGSQSGAQSVSRSFCHHPSRTSGRERGEQSSSYPNSSWKSPCKGGERGSKQERRSARARRRRGRPRRKRQARVPRHSQSAHQEEGLWQVGRVLHLAHAVGRVGGHPAAQGKGGAGGRGSSARAHVPRGGSGARACEADARLCETMCPSGAHLINTSCSTSVLGGGASTSVSGGSRAARREGRTGHTDGEGGGRRRSELPPCCCCKEVGASHPPH